MTSPSAESPSFFARTNFRNKGIPVGIKQADRLSHMYVIGKTGTGKSTLLETLAVQDILHGRGMVLIDPHGDLAERVMQAVPAHRRDDVIYFNVPDPTQPFGYNPLKHVREDKITLAASGLLEAFKKMWPDAWGVRMEAIAPIQNKVGAFLADPTLRHVLTSPEKPLQIRRIMDEGKILIVNLARGQLGEDTTSLLGALLVATAALAAFSRAEVEPTERRPFFVYLDEFQSFTTRSLANMTAELRKYGIGIVAAHQYLTQVEPPVIDAVLGNAGTIICFRLGPNDAAAMAREFEPKFEPTDLLNLPNHEIYLKLMIDGAPSQPFSAVTMRPADLGVIAEQHQLTAERERIKRRTIANWRLQHRLRAA
jgi:type IV secretory pathway TraG/TraD family ATPase VirD4